MFSKTSIPICVVLLLWIVLNAFFLSTNGVRVVNDSARYIEYANGLSSGFYVDRHNFWYIGYAVYLLIFLKVFGSGVLTVVIGQYVLAFLAVVTLYRTSTLLFKSTLSAAAACFLFVAFGDISLWNSYVLTESLYTSFTCFSMYFLTVLYKRSASPTNVILAVLTLIFTFFIKPTGIALLVAVISVVCYEFFQRLRGPVLKGVILVSLTIMLLLLANRMIATYAIIENYAAGEIVFGVRAYKGEHSVGGLAISPPDNLMVPDTSQPPLIQVALFMFHNPIYWTKLFVLKVYYLLVHTRPFWSTVHNLWSLLILPAAYVLFFRKLFDKNLDRQIRTFSIVFLSMHIISVGVTSADWDGRSLIPMLPVIFIFAGDVLGGSLQRISLLHSNLKGIIQRSSDD